MRTIYCKFDGKVIIPDDPAEVALEPDSKLLVHLEDEPKKTQAQIRAEIRAYYQSMTDEERQEEEEWLRATEKDLPMIWDED